MNIDGVDISLDNLGQDLLELLVGERWPNGDEGAMRSLASAWTDAANQLEEIRQTASAAAAQVSEYCKGANGETFQSFWSASFDDGKSSWPSGVAPAALPFAVKFCQSMASALNAGATQIETTKDTIMGNIAILVATVAPQIAAGFFDFGATDATALGEIAVDRTVIESILEGAKTLITEAVEQAIEQGLMQAELNFAIQFKEVAEGHASGIDWGQVEGAGIAGAEGGALGAGFGFGLGKVGGKMLGKDFGTTVADRAAVGVVSGQLTNASLDLIENGKISASDFTKGSLAGVLGGMGGAEAAAAGERPAIDTEDLPTDLPGSSGADTMPNLDLADRTELSGLSLPQAESTPGLDTTAASDGSAAGTATGSSVDGSGLTVDPSQAYAASSSIARILGGGTTEDAGITGYEAPTVSTSTSASAGSDGRGVTGTPSYSDVVGSYEAPTVSTSVSGSDGRGVADTPSYSDVVGSDASVGAGSSAPASEAIPTSARADVGGASDPGYTTVSGADAAPTTDSGTGVSGIGDAASGASQYADTGSSRPASGDVPGVGETVPRDVAAAGYGPLDQTVAASRLGDVTGGGADVAGDRPAGRFYGGRDTVLDGVPDSAPTTYDRSSTADAEPTTMPTADLAEPRGLTPSDTVPAGLLDRPTADPGDTNVLDPTSAESVGAGGLDRPTTEPADVTATDGSRPGDPQPETHVPDNHVPKTTGTDRPTATDGSRPDNADPDAARPDSAQPERTESTRPETDAARPDRPDPDASKPDDTPTRPDTDANHQPNHDPNTPYHDDPAAQRHDPAEQAGSWTPGHRLPEELADVSARAEVSDHGIANFGDPVMADLARRVPPAPDGAFTGDIHGDGRGVISGFTRMTPEEYLGVLDANGHQPGQPIRLLSCEAGAADDGFAAELARVSGCKVTAADTEVWSDQAGHVFASRAHLDDFGGTSPDIPPNGTWHEFSPDGTKTDVGTGGFPPGHEEGFGQAGTYVGETRSRSASGHDGGPANDTPERRDEPGRPGHASAVPPGDLRTSPERADAAITRMEQLNGVEATWANWALPDRAFDDWARNPVEGPLPPLTRDTRLNCWEMVLYSAVSADPPALSHAYVHEMYSFEPLENGKPPDDWYPTVPDYLMPNGRQEYRVGDPDGPQPNRGDIISWNGEGHVAMATGRMHEEDGSPEVMTFWPPPGEHAPDENKKNVWARVDKVKKSSIRELYEYMINPPRPDEKYLNKQGKVIVEFGAGPW